MKKFFLKLGLLLILFSMFTSCDWAKQKAKNTVNKGGEVVSKTGSEFVNGVEKGIEKSFASEIVLSDNLKNSGLEIGKIQINSSENATENILTTYIIFNKNFEGQIFVKIFDADHKEYGRTSQVVKTTSGEAKYIDFTFDDRTNIDGRGTVSFE